MKILFLFLESSDKQKKKKKTLASQIVFKIRNTKIYYAKQGSTFKRAKERALKLGLKILILNLSRANKFHFKFAFVFKANKSRAICYRQNVNKQLRDYNNTL